MDWLLNPSAHLFSLSPSEFSCVKDGMQAALNKHTQADFGFNVYHYMDLKGHISFHNIYIIC